MKQTFFCWVRGSVPDGAHSGKLCNTSISMRMLAGSVSRPTHEYARQTHSWQLTDRTYTPYHCGLVLAARTMVACVHDNTHRGDSTVKSAAVGGRREWRVCPSVLEETLLPRVGKIKISILTIEVFESEITTVVCNHRLILNDILKLTYVMYLHKPKPWFFSKPKPLLLFQFHNTTYKKTATVNPGENTFPFER